MTIELTPDEQVAADAILAILTGLPQSQRATILADLAREVSDD